jgi:hypothetical protein
MRDTRNHVELNVTWIRSGSGAAPVKTKVSFFPTNYLCILFSRSEAPETTGRVNLEFGLGNEADARERTHSCNSTLTHHNHHGSTMLTGALSASLFRMTAHLRVTFPSRRMTGSRMFLQVASFLGSGSHTSLR